MATRVRLTAKERGDEVLRAAVRAFAATGYEGTKTDEIARLAGVSQPYVIRLFGSKQQLFLAAVESVCARIEQIFREAAEERPDLETLGRNYDRLLAEPELLRVLLHSFSASSDPIIGDCVRHRFGSIYALVRDLTGATPTQAREFLSAGMLLTVMSAMQVIGPNPIPLPWSQELTQTFGNG
ncbi:TetR/AcrR family transcriptional regulator [Kribbella solani]|uniref:AcrR family transcriptional regulator n=1 Tax=Kribbella solani TaxID=236067 RepID=A0A841DN97_9ACTN|nr:TetR/AcrR family transcriptional regulator [Kribbella solani]MBB5980604.1 AcrR family transcriptional regulator [Kribbella solani]MDX2968853.1 TetR/AcrR family transcriptional regulator [Kribbella solani]MDX3002642.1 TetR/AcrR family transcriptional regulator [Kribbella solani]